MTHRPLRTSSPLWLSEHYWPALTDGLVLAQAQRTAEVGQAVDWLATLVVPDQQTVFALFAAHSSIDVARALRATGVDADRVSPALRLVPEAPTHSGGSS